MPDASPLGSAIRVIPASWFRPNRAIYWADLLGSAAIGWTALAGAIAAGGWRRATLLAISALALYRAVLFIHEITHLARRDVPGFRFVWNAIVGVPLLLPSFLYEGVHTDHHRQRCYGTPADPEYVPFSHRPPTLIAGFAAASMFLPLALVVRFGVLAPLSWIVPPLRRIVVERMSALVINHDYIRQVPLDRAAMVEEAAATAVVWSVAGSWFGGVLPGAAIVCWLAVSAAASVVNTVRTLAAHLYDRDEPRGAEVTMTSQLLDSCTIAPARGLSGAIAGLWRALWAPVGLRYHALHHWIPSLPYHNLGRAHRLLATTLTADAPYRATEHRAIAPLVADLVRRAANR